MSEPRVAGRVEESSLLDTQRRDEVRIGAIQQRRDAKKPLAMRATSDVERNDVVYASGAGWDRRRCAHAVACPMESHSLK
ncbi:MAG: hypothetical protein HY292_17795 [Planctomycetes bacterium]|nr:hypothetical protein [Planctomycetota bacterium]